MPKLTHENAPDWTRAKTVEMAQFVENEFNISNLVSLLNLRISMSAKRRSSTGGLHKGRPWMSLAIWHYTRPLRSGSKQTFTEYKSIELHPVIGQIKNATGEENITALIAHELAHAVDYFTMLIPAAGEKAKKNIDDGIDFSVAWADGRHKTNGGHGARWQAIYALLRAKFVNAGVTDPTFTEKKKKAARAKAARNGKYAGLTVQLETRRGTPYRYYSFNGMLIAVGFPIYSYGAGERQYKLVAIENNRCTDTLAVLNSGKKAREWIMRNIV